MKHIMACFIPFALAACSPAPDAAAPQAAVATPPSPYAFEINVTFTPRAVEQLLATKERVTVDASYFGIAVSETAPGVDDHGMDVGLGGDMIEIDPANALVTTPGTGFDATNIASIKGEPEVLVNIYSARRTHADNILSCGIYQGPVKMAQEKPVDIRCDLIEWPEGAQAAAPN